VHSTVVIQTDLLDLPHNIGVTCGEQIVQEECSTSMQPSLFPFARSGNSHIPRRLVARGEMKHND
jgi:hypothetical protein